MVGDSSTVGIDVGGTFTDVYFQGTNDSEPKIVKVLTSPILSELGSAMPAGGIDLSACSDLVYSTTLGTNAVLERKLGQCALLTTRGFRDILELGRRDRPRTYGLDGYFDPLIPRQLRFEVNERTLADGTVSVEPSEREVADLASELSNRQIEAIVVCLINSYANPSNERRVGGFLSKLLPAMPVILSAEVHPEWGEFDRATMAALHGTLRKLVGSHLDTFQREVQSRGLRGDVLTMQSNGGVAPVDFVKGFPANLLLSGPAAGVMGASVVARGTSGWTVTCDMGGTSFDVGLLHDARPMMTSRTEIAFRVPLPISTVDVHEVAAGGGSIARVVAGRLLTIGPESAGSLPGPACYGLGGELPTVTDAALLLNRFVEGRGFGSVSQIFPDRGLAEKAIRTYVANPLGIDVLDAAEAIVSTAAVVMAGGVRTMSVGRGLDPRLTTLMVGGGAGPQFACEFAREVGVRRLVFPRHPGVINALGCAVTDLRQDYARTINTILRDENLSIVRETMLDQRRQAEGFVKSVGVEEDRILYAVEFEMQYTGQTHTFTVPLTDDGLTSETLRNSFDTEYSKWQGRGLHDVDVNIRSVKTAVTATRRKIEATKDPSSVSERRRVRATGKQLVTHGRDQMWSDVYDGEALTAGDEIVGPALIGQLDSSVWLPPGSSTVVQSNGSLGVELHS